MPGRRRPCRSTSRSCASPAAAPPRHASAGRADGVLGQHNRSLNHLGYPRTKPWKLSRSSWQEFIPFLANDVEIRRVLCSTNAIESLKARAGRAQDPLPGDSLAGPQGQRAGTMDHPMEARPERVRDHLRRPHAGGGEPLTNATYTVGRTVPTPKTGCGKWFRSSRSTHPSTPLSIGPCWSHP